MGGPGTTEEIPQFLFNVFSDEDLIVLPRPLRPLQPWIASRASKRRLKAVTPMYSAIGGRSPIVETTISLARNVERALSSQGKAIPVYAAMRYTEPRAIHAALDAERRGVDEILLLPLYPHYTNSTTGSSIKDFLQASQEVVSRASVRSILEYSDEPGYVQLWVERVQRTIDKVPDGLKDEFHLIFSAHGLPLRYVRNDERYPKGVRECAERIAARLRGVDSWHLSFQSRFGPLEWTRPYTDELIRELGRQGVKALVVVPLGFVSDHIETLYEIDVLYENIARESGIEHFARCPTFNDDDDFAAFLAALAMRELDGEERSVTVDG